MADGNVTQWLNEADSTNIISVSGSPESVLSLGTNKSTSSSGEELLSQEFENLSIHSSLVAVASASSQMSGEESTIDLKDVFDGYLLEGIRSSFPGRVTTAPIVPDPLSDTLHMLYQFGFILGQQNEGQNRTVSGSTVRDVSFAAGEKAGVLMYNRSLNIPINIHDEQYIDTCTSWLIAGLHAGRYLKENPLPT